MKDAIGQEINEGDKVAWGDGRYAGFSVYTVERLTPKRVKVYRRLGGVVYTVDPENLIVITSNIERMN